MRDFLLCLKWVNLLLVQTFEVRRYTPLIQVLRQKDIALRLSHTFYWESNKEKKKETFALCFLSSTSIPSLALKPTFLVSEQLLNYWFFYSQLAIVGSA